MVGVMSPRLPRLWAWAMVVAAIAGCVPAASDSPVIAPVATPSTGPTSTSTQGADTVILVGRIVTMDEPPSPRPSSSRTGSWPRSAPGTRSLALAGDKVPIIDIGENVAYPGFIDAHAHWIGDRGYYGLDTPAEAMDAALSRGWTSISEQWVNQERLDELETLAADDAAPDPRGRLPRAERADRRRPFRRLVRRPRRPGPSPTACASGA